MNSIFEYATALSVDENVMEGMSRDHLNEPISQTSMNRPQFFFMKSSVNTLNFLTRSKAYKNDVQEY